MRDTTYTAKVEVLDTLPAALATSGNGKLTYALTPKLPTGLTFNNMTRVISGTPTTAASARTYTLTATDADANTAASDTDTLTFTISVYSAPTFAATKRDTTYTVNTAVSDTLPGATGGTGTLTYALTPALPDSLTYKAATSGNGGVIAGTPTTAAPARTYTLTATATDANIAASDTDTLTFTLAVRNALARPGKPTNVQVKPWVAAIIVSWDTVTTANGYKVRWKSGSDTTYSAIRERTPTTTTDTIPDLKAGTTYTVQVIATRRHATDSDPVEVTGMPASLDIDGNGEVKLFSDIILIKRYVLFFQGEALIRGNVIEPDATRTTAQEIEPYLDTLVNQNILDVDGDGDVRLFSDIILIIRYVLFFRNEALIRGNVIEQNATRTTSQAIESYICSLRPNCSPPSKAAISMDVAETAHILSALAADGDLTSLLFALGVLLPTADFDGDGQVTFADFLTFAGKFGTRRGEERYDARCDLNGDGEIGFSDFLIFADSFGSAD